MARMFDGGDTAPVDALIAEGASDHGAGRRIHAAEFLDNGNWTKAQIEARSEQKRRAARARWDKAREADLNG